MAAFDPISHLKTFTLRASRLLTNDLKAIPPEKQSVCPADCARSPLNILAECALINGRIAHYLTAGEMLPRHTPKERSRILAGYDTQEKALAFLESETKKLITALGGLDPDRLDDTTDVLFGRPMTVFTVAELPAVHMMYHDGQLNYIQTLLGDMEMHWG